MLDGRPLALYSPTAYNRTKAEAQDLTGFVFPLKKTSN